MAYIANWLAEEQQAAEAQLTIDDTFTRLQERDGILDPFMPRTMYRDRDFLIYITEKMQTVASIIGYGAEPPTTSAGKLQKIRGQLFKAGLSFDYPEEMQWRMRDAIEMAQLRRVMVQDAVVDGQIIRGSNNDLAGYLFQTIADMTLAQVNLLDALTWQALQFGQVSWTDPRTNTTQTVDYTDPEATYDHFPADLSGPDLWTNYATANAIRVLEDDVETFRDTNGFMPDAIVMSDKLRRHMKFQQSTLLSYSSMTTSLGSVSLTGSVGNPELNALMERRELPPIITFDEMYQIEATNKTLSNARFLNTDRYVFMVKGVGERALGPTLEGDGAEGIYVVNREIRNYPPQDATQGVATLMPVIPNPKRLFSRKVA
jgi:hypothetical protein